MSEGVTEGMEWSVEGESPLVAMRRNAPVLRGGMEYKTGTLWLVSDGERCGRLTYEVHDALGMVQLGNVDVDDPELRGRGGASTMLGELEMRFPSPRWWLAADDRDLHSPEGLALIRSRRKPGRRCIHTSLCTVRADSDCTCWFTGWDADGVVDTADDRDT